MEIYDNIDRELEKRRMSRRKLALSIGVPPSTFQSMMERKRGMTIELLKKISAALNVDFYSLADFDMASDALFEEINANRKATKEEQLLQHFRTLNDNGQTVAVERVQELTQIPPTSAPRAPHRTRPPGWTIKNPPKNKTPTAGSCERVTAENSAVSFNPATVADLKVQLLTI